MVHPAELQRVANPSVVAVAVAVAAHLQPAEPEPNPGGKTASDAGEAKSAKSVVFLDEGNKSLYHCHCIARAGHHLGHSGTEQNQATWTITLET